VLPKPAPPTTRAPLEFRAHLVLCSGNVKTGPIPVSVTERVTCPDACPFRGTGCYADYGPMRHAWRAVDSGERGKPWLGFCQDVTRLPPGTLWRHNEAGDLPGVGDAIDEPALAMLVEANHDRRGFTFTHKPVFDHPENRRAIREANQRGFTVNLSADNIEEADAMAAYGIAPVTVVLPHDASDRPFRTPAGHQVVVCPAQTSHLTCADCQLCAVPERRSIVGFRAHGQFKHNVTKLIQLGLGPRSESRAPETSLRCTSETSATRRPRASASAPNTPSPLRSTAPPRASRARETSPPGGSDRMHRRLARAR
jgi:hypothetical protein